MPTQIIPYLFYRDVPAALEWLTRAFGFKEEMRHPTPSGMHAQMLFDGQRVMMGQGSKDWRMESPGEGGTATQGVFIYLADVDALHERAGRRGWRSSRPKDESYGRTCTIRDLDGHPWFFTTPPAGD